MHMGDHTVYGIMITGLTILLQIGGNKDYYHGLNLKRSNYILQNAICYNLIYCTTINFHTKVKLDQEYKFIKTEYCAGGNLEVWLRRHPQNVDVRYIFNQVMTFHVFQYSNDMCAQSCSFSF